MPYPDNPNARQKKEDRVSLLGVEIDPLTVDQLHQIIRTAVETDDHLFIPNVNIYGMNLAYEDPTLRAIYNDSDWLFCDGAGIQLGARVTGQSLPARITYADWMWQLGEFAAAEGISLYFLGAQPGVAEQAADRLRARFPSLQIVGTQHGYFDLEATSDECRQVVAEINRVKPDILLVGMGMPLQEYWLAQNWAGIDAHVALTGGAVFDYISGNLQRGPAVLNDHGFEWLSRLLIEPRRLWKRYLVGNPVFLWRVLKEAAASDSRRQADS